MEYVYIGMYNNRKQRMRSNTDSKQSHFPQTGSTNNNPRLIYTAKNIHIAYQLFRNKYQKYTGLPQEKKEKKKVNKGRKKEKKTFSRHRVLSCLLETKFPPFPFFFFSLPAYNRKRIETLNQRRIRKIAGKRERRYL